MIRNVLARGMRQGLNPRSVALDIVGRIDGATKTRQGGLIGLTSSQEEWVRRYAEDLASDNPLDALSRTLRDKRFDAMVRKYAALGEPIPADKIEKMVAAYRNRALRYRAEAIARTEAMRALHQSQDEAIKQAIEKGILKADAVGFVWRTARDARVMFRMPPEAWAALDAPGRPPITEVRLPQAVRPKHLAHAVRGIGRLAHLRLLALPAPGGSVASSRPSRAAARTSSTTVANESNGWCSSRSDFFSASNTSSVCASDGATDWCASGTEMAYLLSWMTNTTGKEKRR